MNEVRLNIGRIWGRTTTLILSIGTAVLAVPIPPEIITNQIRWTVFGLALVVAALRVLAPPCDKEGSE